MSVYGNPIGLAVERVGKKKVAQEPSTEDLSLKSITKNQENMNGLIGEFKHTSRNRYLIFGKRRFQNSTTMMMNSYSRSLLKLLKMMESVE